MSFHHEIRAEVITDSVTSTTLYGVTRLTTIEVTFHRFILAEVNTHRKLSRNSASSRAIPLEKMLERAMTFPAIPVELPSEQPGMQGGEPLEGDDFADALQLIDGLRERTTHLIRDYIQAHPDKSTRLHKSVVNRYLEPFMWHTAVLSSTEWENLLDQRAHKDAQPEFRELAYLIREALKNSEPVSVPNGGLHLPYIGLNPDDATLEPMEKLQVSSARCARVSYLTHDGRRDLQDDFRLFRETLSNKGHWSPMEHAAIAWSEGDSNFDKGWTQLRWFYERKQQRRLEAALEGKRVPG